MILGILSCIGSDRVTSPKFTASGDSLPGQETGGTLAALWRFALEAVRFWAGNTHVALENPDV